MEEGIQAQLDGGDAADPEFLAAVQKRLALAKAKARLREIHEALLRKHLDRIVAAPDHAEDVAAAMGWADEDNVRLLCCPFFRTLHARLSCCVIPLAQRLSEGVSAAIGWAEEDNVSFLTA